MTGREVAGALTLVAVVAGAPAAHAMQAGALVVSGTALATWVAIGVNVLGVIVLAYRFGSVMGRHAQALDGLTTEVGKLREGVDHVSVAVARLEGAQKPAHVVGAYALPTGSGVAAQ